MKALQYAVTVQYGAGFHFFRVYKDNLPDAVEFANALQESMTRNFDAGVGKRGVRPRVMVWQQVYAPIVPSTKAKPQRPSLSGIQDATGTVAGTGSALPKPALPTPPHPEVTPDAEGEVKADVAAASCSCGYPDEPCRFNAEDCMVYPGGHAPRPQIIYKGDPGLDEEGSED